MTKTRVLAKSSFSRLLFQLQVTHSHCTVCDKLLNEPMQHENHANRMTLKISVAINLENQFEMKTFGKQLNHFKKIVEG